MISMIEGVRRRRARWHAWGLLWIGVWPLGVAVAAPLEIKLLFLGTADSSAHRGAQQGLEEANAQGEFLGQHYRLVVAAPVARSHADASALVVAGKDSALLKIAASNPALPVLNVGSDSDQLRTTCRANLLHVLPSRKMLTDALAQWHTAHPEATGIQARAWHARFDKYSASQLNKRYQEKFKTAMDDQAWAGWAAVKLISDLIAREQTADGQKLLKALRTDLKFDGQKGIEMSFRATGQLRQPLLLVAEDRVVGEAPVRGVVEIENLDSLGATACAHQ